ncbi:MAG: amidohydrolase [Chloroflexota bacterium]
MNRLLHYDMHHALYFNGVFRGNRGRPAECMWVTDGKVGAIGMREDVSALVPPGCEMVNLRGATVVPGFNDCHCHILSEGLNLRRVDLSPERAGTIAGIQRLLRTDADRLPSGAWLLGRGYDQNMLAERRHPNRHDLDSARGDRPVAIWHTSSHMLCCNSPALELAGVSAASPDPAGGEIERDSEGQPTGVFKEAPAIKLVTSRIPRPSEEEGSRAIVAAMSVMASQGITSATDAATGEGDSLEPELNMYGLAMMSGELRGRITLMPQIMYVAPEGEPARRRQDFHLGDRPEKLRIGATKIFTDGALSTRTAAVREPYLDGTRGILLWPQPVLEEMVLRAHRAGWQIASHALGDAAILAVLNAYERAQGDCPRHDHRHRIEHCLMPDADLAKRMARLGVIANLQPDMTRLGDGYVSALGLERASLLMPMRLFRQYGVRSAFSSDRPVVPGAPLDVIRDAAVRRTPAGVILGEDDRVDAMDGVRLYTAGGAFAEHRENELGALAPGMLADFVILSEDPAHVPPDDLNSIGILGTVVGGEMVWEA